MEEEMGKKKGKVKGNTEVADRIGPPCPRCGHDTQVRVHKRITDKLLRQPFYYSEWYYCSNKRCRTSLLMPDKFKVYPDVAEKVQYADEGLTRRLDAVKRQLMPAGGPLPWED